MTWRSTRPVVVPGPEKSCRYQMNWNVIDVGFTAGQQELTLISRLSLWSAMLNNEAKSFQYMRIKEENYENKVMTERIFVY